MILNENRKFIMTEQLGKDGEYYEKKVWDCVKSAFADNKCVGYWKYPIFSKSGTTRKEPDILIVDKELGLVVIEVKGLKIDQIESINGHLWKYKNFYVNQGSPYEQAENQLFAILGHCDLEPGIRRKITGRAIVALPMITREEWQKKGLDRLPSCPPIIFKDDLSKVTLLNKIKQSQVVISGEDINEDRWKILLSILSGTPVLRKNIDNTKWDTKTRAGIVSMVREQIHSIDLQQEHIGKIIPPGAQRIRGIAGSGKTVLLCQKAAHMHLKHPDWNIAVVFFTRSLYESIINMVDKWIRRFTNGHMRYDPLTNNKLRVLHAWGAKDKPGFYGEICRANGVRRLTVKDVPRLKPNESLGYACKQLLEDIDIQPIFDAVLIDEGQDLVVDKDELKYEGDKQPFYWMAYKALKPVDDENPNIKRLIWAYDEAQSLDNLKIPSASELFGEEEELRRIVSGVYKGGVRKSEIMHRCYRTPGEILTAAHAIGMGLMRKNGMLRGFTTKKDWENIGYMVEKGNFNPPGQEIILARPQKNSPNLVSKYWKKSVIEFKTYNSRQDELIDLANKIKHNIEIDGLNPSREILVVVLGNSREAIELERHVARFLMDKGVDIYIPTALENNMIYPKFPNIDNDKFWNEGAVTVSRIHRAKGNEAEMVYVVGFDKVAEDESNINLRNQVFVALTRARGWVNLSGVGNDYPLYEEMREVINSKQRFKFTFKKAPEQDIGENEIEEAEALS